MLKLVTIFVWNISNVGRSFHQGVKPHSFSGKHQISGDTWCLKPHSLSSNLLLYLHKENQCKISESHTKNLMASMMHQQFLQHRGWTGRLWQNVPSKQSEAQRVDLTRRWTALESGLDKSDTKLHWNITLNLSKFVQNLSFWLTNYWPSRSL